MGNAYPAFFTGCIVLISTASAQDTCTDRIKTARHSSVNTVIKTSESMQRLAFCADSFREFNEASENDASARYGIFSIKDSNKKEAYEKQKSSICQDYSAEIASKDLASQIETSIGLDELKALCPPITFACHFDQKTLTLKVYNSEQNREMRAYFDDPLVSNGSLRIMKNAVKKGQELLPNSSGGEGYPIPLELVKGREAESGKVTIKVSFGPSRNKLGRSESCSAYRDAKEVQEVRQKIETWAGSSDPNTAIKVNTTFSRIRNDADDREYEWFYFIPKDNGNVVAKLYAQKTRLQLRIHAGPNLKEVPGNNTIVRAGLSEVVQFKVAANTKYVIGIQAYDGGPTGAQLDVSYSKR